MVGVLLFTMRLVCWGVTFWCERHAHAMTSCWAALHVCIRCKTCNQLFSAKAAISKTNVAIHILTKSQLLPLCAVGNSVKSVLLVLLWLLFCWLVHCLLFCLQAQVFFMLLWSLNYTLFFSVPIVLFFCLGEGNLISVRSCPHKGLDQSTAAIQSVITYPCTHPSELFLVSRSVFKVSSNLFRGCNWPLCQHRWPHKCRLWASQSTSRSSHRCAAWSKMMMMKKCAVSHY